MYKIQQSFAVSIAVSSTNCISVVDRKPSLLRPTILGPNSLAYMLRNGTVHSGKSTMPPHCRPSLRRCRIPLSAPPSQTLTTYGTDLIYGSGTQDRCQGSMGYGCSCLALSTYFTLQLSLQNRKMCVLKIGPSSKCSEGGGTTGKALYHPV